MATQEDLDRTYLNMASVWSSLSKARRKRVGCLIVKDGSIISDGFNGTPRGFNNDCETMIPHQGKIVIDDEGDFVEGTYKLITKSEVIHAESNAIIKLSKSTQSSEGSTMYITISPCIDCAKLIIQAGISRVVHGGVYRSEDGLNLLSRANIQIHECKI
jgi:dCMP deaminase|tara:strand:- start:4240 stop:4716 length:477 start_codon:yes stop_codon:yes gene_type:complete